MRSSYARWAVIALALVTTTCARPDAAEQASGPDGRLALSASIAEDGTLRVRLRRDGADLLDPSPVGLSLQGETSQPMQILGVDRSGADALKVRAQETGGKLRRLDLHLRAFDDGVAFRLVLPPQPGLETVRITGESTRFVLLGDTSCNAVEQREWKNSHEGDYAPVQASDLRADRLYDLPLVCATGRAGETIAFAESDLEGFAAAYLAGGGGGRPEIAVKLTPRSDDDRLAVVRRMGAQGVKTPWRIVMVADRPERLIENDLVQRLAPPSRIGDASWVVPGKAAWGWWSGLLAPGVPDPGHNDATYRHYIDFAARFGLPYIIIDRGWAWRPDGRDSPADIARTRDGVDVPELVRYARDRGVRIWLWANWTAFDGRMDEVLALYRRIGIAGIKVDYIYRQDQEAVAFYHKLLSTAAKHRLMVNMHASFVPRGLERTYPNYLTQEGVMGLEYNKWGRKVTAGYNVRTAYTRAAIGPMDYTPGGFRNVSPERFEPRGRAPLVQTTRAHQLALFVVYPSPLMSLADAPSAYEVDGRPAPGADFLRVVPAGWDEVRGVAGERGRWIAVARRRGDRWYMGVIGDEQARTVVLPMSLLGNGRWRAGAWTDGVAPTDVVTRGATVEPGTRLRVRLSGSGGAALVITPERGEGQ